MKKFLTLLMVASIFSLVACGPTEEEQAKIDADAEEMANDLMKGFEDAMEEVAEEEVAEEVMEEEATEGEEEMEGEEEAAE